MKPSLPAVQFAPTTRSAPVARSAPRSRSWPALELFFPSKRIAVLWPLVFLLSLSSCSSDRASKEPTRDAVISLLNEFHQALLDEDYNAATALYLAPTGTEDDIAKAVPEWIDRKEISAEGIRALGKEGQFGPLLAVFPKKGPYWAKSVGLSPETMWGLRLGPAEVAVAITEGKMRIVRLDEVGRFVIAVDLHE